jgi:hypothetical protein
MQVIELPYHLLPSLMLDSFYEVHHVIWWTGTYINVQGWTWKT